MKPQIELHIEELVLHGFAPGDRYLIGDAVEHELVRLFVEQDTPPSLTRGGSVAELNAGTFEIARGSTPEVIGAQLAHAVYAGVNG